MRDKLTRYETRKRVYPQVGKVDTIHDIRELVNAIEKSKISRDRKRKRIQFLYSLTYTKTWKRKFRGKINRIRDYLKRKYQKYMKNKPKRSRRR